MKIVLAPCVPKVRACRGLAGGVRFDSLKTNSQRWKATCSISTIEAPTAPPQTIQGARLRTPEGRNNIVVKRFGPINAVHITSPIISLVEGMLRGETTIGETLRSGDFGLGTLNDLDGEVVILGGVAYQQSADGLTRVVDPSEKTPYMTTTFLEMSTHKPQKLCDLHSEDHGPLDFASLQEVLERQLASPNLFHAILVKAQFHSIRARAARKQDEPRGLLEAVRDQAMFEFQDEEGWLVGFYSPHFMGSSIAVPGFHLHFLSADRRRGGHVVDCSINVGSVLMHPIFKMVTSFPRSAEFRRAELRNDCKLEIEEAERGCSRPDWLSDAV